MDSAMFMTDYFYSDWFRKDVSPNLTKDKKESLLKRLSDYSLEHPIGVVGVTISHAEFPELVKFSHTKEFTGIQLYSVMKELFKELHSNSAKNIFGGV